PPSAPVEGINHEAPLPGLKPDALDFRFRDLGELDRNSPLEYIGNHFTITLDIRCGRTVEGAHENARYVNRPAGKEIGGQFYAHRGDLSLCHLVADPAHIRR